jgi:hypothetical protein
VELPAGHISFAFVMVGQLLNDHPKEITMVQGTKLQVQGIRAVPPSCFNFVFTS